MHINPEYASLKEIKKTTNRLAFNIDEIAFLVEFIKQNRRKGLETGIHPFMKEEFDCITDDGFLFISLDDLQRTIVYVKLNSGLSLFGRQKSSFLSYIGSIGEDEFMAGTTFKSWGIAVTAINNIYRSLNMI